MQAADHQAICPGPLVHVCLAYQYAKLLLTVHAGLKEKKRKEAHMARDTKKNLRNQIGV